ncbi:hypothetical protein [Mesorhizobium australafricanum]|uniref:hypothetical protein n=1 Tax=Mesorhizobium australafricanum TaxID=3072311 RepID=UPI003D3150BB
MLDNAEILTENVAIRDWLAAKHPALGVPRSFGRIRVLESLSFINARQEQSHVRI